MATILICIYFSIHRTVRIYYTAQANTETSLHNAFIFSWKTLKSERSYVQELSKCINTIKTDTKLILAD